MSLSDPNDGIIPPDSKQFIHFSSVTNAMSVWLVQHVSSLAGAARLSISALKDVPTSLSAFSNEPGYITSADLSGYVTSSSLVTTLSGYVTNSSLATTLSWYVTNSALASALSSYITTTNFTWANLSGKPASFTPSAHAASHAAGGSDVITITQAQVTDLGTALSGKQATVALTTTGTGAASFNPVTGALNIPTPVQQFVYVTISGTSVTLDATNCARTNTIIRTTGASAITATYAPGQPTGESWVIEQCGAGVVTVDSPVGGSRNGTRFKSAGQWTMMFIHHVGGNVLGFEGGVS